MATEQSSNSGASLYSHDETVEAITSYYKLVSRAHAIFESSELQHPPPEGWPQLSDPNVAAGFGFNDEALKLIRHIPYFEYPESVQILPDVQPHSYIEESLVSGAQGLGESILRGEGKLGEDHAPPHLVLLGVIPPSREYGSEVWLDTKLGNVIMGNYHRTVQIDIGVEPDGIYPEPDDNSYDELFNDYDQKGEGSCWRISTFFAACERYLRDLYWMPGMDEGEEGYILPEGESLCSELDYEERKQILLDNGWPGDNWNPAGVMAELGRPFGSNDSGEDEANDE